MNPERPRWQIGANFKLIRKGLKARCNQKIQRNSTDTRICNHDGIKRSKEIVQTHLFAKVQRPKTSKMNT